MKYRFFISSVQDEFAAERRRLKEWLTTDPFVSRFVDACRKNGNPDPEFEQRGPSFIVRLWKDMWTPLRLASVGATERQIAAVMMLKEKGRLTTTEYAKHAQIGLKTAKRDFIHLDKLGVVTAMGDRKGTFYTLRNLSDIYRTSIDGTVNSNAPQRGGGRSVSPLKNKGGVEAGVHKRDKKIKCSRSGAKVSDGTVNGTVNHDVLGGVSSLLALVKSNPGCRANVLAEMSGKGVRTVKRYLAALVLLNQVEFRGAPKTGGYYPRAKE